MDELTRFLPNVAFPVAVAAFLLVRLDASLRALERAIWEMHRDFRATRGPSDERGVPWRRRHGDKPWPQP